MVTETDRNKARSAVVSAYNALDCVTIPFSFLHAFADAAVDAVSTDAEPVALYRSNEKGNSWLQWLKSPDGYADGTALYAEPVKTAPAAAVKALEWSNEDNGDFIAQSIVGWYHIGLPNLTWNLMTPNGDVPSFHTLKEAKAAAQADYETRILSALSAQVQEVAGLLDETWNTAVERAAEIANDCVHLTPDPGAAIRAMLNGRTMFAASKHGDAE